MLPTCVTTITVRIVLSISLASDLYSGGPHHTVQLTARMLDLVIAMCSILLLIRHQQKCDGPACVWQVGHVLIVNATSSHLVPKTGFVRAGHSCVHHLRITRALVAVQLIFRSTTGLCLQIGLLVVGRIGSVRDSDAAVNVAQAQQCHYKGHEVQNEMCVRVFVLCGQFVCEGSFAKESEELRW